MTDKAADGFDSYFSEKIWQMIPSIYRHEDGIAKDPGVLRALVELIAQHAAILRRSHDRLWEDQFIDYCSDWVVPYIADLLGTRLVSAKNLRGRRVDVAKTIYYRRRKGTLRVLEELISDITGWEGKVNENFRRLARTRHGLDPHPLPLAGPFSPGRFSGTMPGGWADLRKQRASELASGPFCEFHHTPDMRRHEGVEGQYAISKLAFFLYRVNVYQVEDVTPFSRNGGGFTFDPSGRNIPVFSKRSRPPGYDWDEWHSAREWELPAPIPCRLLGHAEYQISERAVRILEDQHGFSTDAATELRTLNNIRFTSENKLIHMLKTLNHINTELDPGGSSNLAAYETLLKETIVEDCGKNALLPGSILVKEGETEVVKEKITAANLIGWNAAVSLKRLAISPELGRFMFTGATHGEVKVTYHYGSPGPIGAGTYERFCLQKSPPPAITGGGSLSAVTGNRVNQIDDSATYTQIYNKTVTNMTLQAANHQRPYIRLAKEWRLSTGSNLNSTLILDGLWIGAAAPAPGEKKYNIVLTGNYEKVLIRHCTLDPGEETAVDANKKPIHAVSFVINGYVERLEIESSITGPIVIGDNGLLEKLTIRNSILQAQGETPAINFLTASSSSRSAFKLTPTSFGYLEKAGVPANALIKLDSIKDRVFAVKSKMINTTKNKFIDKVKNLIGSALTKAYKPALLKYSSLASNTTEVELNRVTVFGQIKVHRLWASDTLITGRAEVTDTQNGCFRFSAAPLDSRLPRAYESYMFVDHAHYFTSRSFAEPGYGQLSETAPVEIERGAENGAEMGAFNSLLNPIKMDSLQAKVDEYMPFGRIPIFIKET
jgi:hypothetical protein